MRFDSQATALAVVGGLHSLRGGAVRPPNPRTEVRTDAERGRDAEDAPKDDPRRH